MVVGAVDLRPLLHPAPTGRYCAVAPQRVAPQDADSDPSVAVGVQVHRVLRLVGLTFQLVVDRRLLAIDGEAEVDLDQPSLAFR